MLSVSLGNTKEIRGYLMSCATLRRRKYNCQFQSRIPKPEIPAPPVQVSNSITSLLSHTFAVQQTPASLHLGPIPHHARTYLLHLTHPNRHAPQRMSHRIPFQRSVTYTRQSTLGETRQRQQREKAKYIYMYCTIQYVHIPRISKPNPSYI